MIKIIPVLDVMDGVVVHAVAGRRSEYKPLRNTILEGAPDPKRILEGLYKLGFREVYIADLDSIMERGCNHEVIDYACKTGFRVLADVGRAGVELRDTSSTSYVIGTEYLEYPFEGELVSGRVSSLDCMGFNTIFRNTRVVFSEAVKVVSKAKKLIVLDLSVVGTSQGPNIELVRSVRGLYNGELLYGGGVKSLDDVRRLSGEGVSGVLVATAIHKGIITKSIY